MKKITPLVIVLLFCVEILVSQEITNSTSMEILGDNSISCNTQGITRANSFYRVFNPENYGIFTAYHINTFQFGIEKLAGAPYEGYPMVISIYSYANHIANFPNEDDLILRGEVTEMLANQSLTVHTTAIDAIIPTNQKFLVKISIASDTADEGGNNNVQFEIGSNNEGELSPSYIQAEACSITSPLTFESQGRTDIHMVMQVIGTSATAGVDELANLDFRYLPNPVTDRLILKAKENITSISLYNLLGQEIKKLNPSQLEVEVDLSSLKAGTYLVKVLMNNKTGRFKIVKI